MKVFLVAVVCVAALATTDAFVGHFGGFPGHFGFMGRFPGMFPHGLAFPYTGHMGMNYGYQYTPAYAPGAVPEYSGGAYAPGAVPEYTAGGASHGSAAYNTVPEPATVGTVMPY